MTVRLRFAGALAISALFGLIAACGFGIDVDSAFGNGGAGAGDGSVVGPTPEGGIPTLQVLSLAAGNDFTCGLRVDGSVMCWGQSDDGRLGNGLPTPSSVPVLVQDITDAVDLAAGSDHACAVRKSGSVSCWGYNSSRQLGDGTTDSATTPRTVVALSDAQKVAAGSGFTCALKKDATVVCWGNDDNGQLGDGTTTARSQPAPVVGLADVMQIGTSNSTACALVKSGDVLCWGADDHGQTGVPPAAAPPQFTPTPTKVNGLAGVVSISSSGVSNHFCAVLGSGELRCWGYGGSGEIGDAKGADDNPTPAAAVSINDAVGVGTGGAYTCTWRKNGTVSCWGDNSWRKLGLGDSSPPDNISSPLPVNGLADVEQVATGSDHACALMAKGSHISCWGENTAGALGRATVVISDVPSKAVFAGPMAKIRAGGGGGLAIDPQGGLWGWGYNSYRQLATRDFRATGTPTLVAAVSGVTNVAGGNLHTCAVLAGGQVQCWGLAQYGQLGDGQTPYIKSTPVVFGAPSPATDVGAGENFSCALLSSGEIACSGQNYDSRLGISGGQQDSPVLVLSGPQDPDGGPPPPSFTGATQLSVGGAHSCVLYGGGTLACWGNNDNGQRGASGVGVAPNDVSLAPAPTAFVAGGAHTCAVLQDGSVRCWGANSHGQVSGSGPKGTSQRTPDLAGKQAKALAAGDEHTCALLTDGTVSCWGAGTYGELGNGVRADSPTPVAVKDLKDVTGIAASNHFTCALVTDGSVWCWGDNTSGQLGDGTVMTTGVPGAVAGY